MSKNRKKVYYYITGVLVLLAIFVYLRLRANAADATKVLRPIPTVQISDPHRGSIERTISFTGDIDAIQEATIFPRVNGNIEEEYVNIGSYVRKGEILALIDTAVYSENVRQARGVYLQARATLENDKLTYERNKSLLSQNLIAKQDLDNSEAAYKVALAQEQAAAATMKNAEIQLGYCRVQAPFTGYVTRRFFDPGTYVTSSTNATSSTLFYLADLNKVKVLVNVLEEDIPLLPKVEDAQIKVDAYPSMVFHGKITRVSQQLDLSTRTMPVEVDIDNPHGLLKPGMFANVDLIFDRVDNALVLPSQVVLKDDSGSYVYTLGAGDIVHKNYVKIGVTHDNDDQVISGLNDNAPVVFMGYDMVHDGMKVRVAR
ncbi:MAG: efflux RND transporter periplasmic adaptor subunit [Bacteroidetes bacterium]|nr:efflux RND transporter periplasmic adaptor subunit [Bacteroidota bacterium]